MTTRAVSICTYNRGRHIGEVIEGVLSTVPNGTDVFVCDDGSDHDQMPPLFDFPSITVVAGPNLGVAGNKNRALWMMKDHHFSVILEDDLVPTDKGWFETYEAVSVLTDIHHFCRVQDKTVPESKPGFTAYLKAALNVTPVYASSPRGDFTFLTRKVITTIGGFNPAFKGVGYAHGSWSERAIKAGLVSHPNGWVDIVEARDKFKQVGDTEGGRWDHDQKQIKAQLKKNRLVAKQLKKTGELYCPLTSHAEAWKNKAVKD